MGTKGELSPEEQAIIEEEEALLARVQASLAQAALRAEERPRGGDLRSTEALRALREEAASSSEDDLPALLLELSIRQRLRERPEQQPLPDPRSPYLAHLRLGEGAQRKDYLLGRASFLDPAAGVRIVDWKVAPVAQIFYRYREGDEFEEPFPGRMAEGIVEARRIVVIDAGALSQIVGDGVALHRGPDGAWVSTARAGLELSPGGAGSAARPGVLGVGVGAASRPAPIDVTALLDAQQFEAIRAPAEQALLVLGSAGSGKTTVALHRLARIAATEPARHPLSAMRVVVPEEGLARLSRRLLAPLGMGGAQVDTLDAWALQLTCAVFGGKAPALCTDPPALVTSLKRHPALYAALRRRFASLAPEDTTLRSLRRRLARVMSDRRFLAEVVEAAGGDLSRAAIEETVRHTVLQLATPVHRALESIVVPEMKVAVDGRPLAEGTPDELAGTLDLEDLPILLFLRAYRGAIEAPGVTHLVLDEAEDLALFELFVLGRLLGPRPSVTLAGDEAQQTSSSFAGWAASLGALGAGEAAVVRLELSYRCPRPVAELAQRILGAEAPIRAAREGAPVGRFHAPDEASAQLFLAGAVRELLDREPRASVAVIARDEASARGIHALFADRPEARLVLHGEFSFEPGVDITDVESCKGLEFDYVVIPDATEVAYPATAESRRRLHVAVTRAAHQVWLVSSGAASPLLA